MENKRRKLHEQLEVVQEGFANGVAPGFPLNDEQKLYKAFTIDDEWLIGFGMDDSKGFNRNLPSIWAL